VGFIQGMTAQSYLGRPSLWEFTKYKDQEGGGEKKKILKKKN